jgi:hypothetical protein
VRFRNAARAGLGLALAVLVAKTTSVQHAFWVVLGALAVLRSNALGTGATALQAFIGALVGFGVASAVMLTIGANDALLWILLPPVVFLAAYTPGAVNFVVGQASFTVFVVVLFNILAPDGWRTALVRVQDVAIGAGISVVVGALLWPRGARGVARRAFAELLRAGGDHLRLALGVTLDGRSPDEARRAGATAADARDRAVAALEDLALEHGGGSVDRQAWGTLLLDAGVLEVAGNGITHSGAVHGVAGDCAPARTALAEEGQSVCTRIGREADLLERSGAAATVSAHAGPPDASRPVLPSLEACLSTHASDGLDGAVGLVWVHEWLTLVTEQPR